jgi:hypothetical protein
MKNQKGISLIALIITIIVIIILAAIVISSAVTTPEQANWAKFCGNYAEIQSAVSTKSAEVYGDIMLDPLVTTKPSLSQVRTYIISVSHLANAAWPTGEALPEPSQEWPAEIADGATQVISSTNNQLGLSGFNLGSDWVIDNEGVLYHATGVVNPNDNGLKYLTPTAASVVPTT